MWSHLECNLKISPLRKLPPALSLTISATTSLIPAMLSPKELLFKSEDLLGDTLSAFDLLPDMPSFIG